MQPAAYIDCVELIHDAGCARFEVLTVSIRPPIFQRTVSVELRAAIIELMADLMPDNRPDRSVVGSIIGICIEKGRLQYPGWEHDFDISSTRISVHGRRGHAPVNVANGLADFGDLIVLAPRPGCANVCKETAAVDLHGRVIMPCVGITDLHLKGIEFSDGE